MIILPGFQRSGGRRVRGRWTLQRLWSSAGGGTSSVASAGHAASDRAALEAETAVGIQMRTDGLLGLSLGPSIFGALVRRVERVARSCERRSISVRAPPR
jgi:hypothetical protein